jgi:hypothetical protein
MFQSISRSLNSRRSVISPSFGSSANVHFRVAGILVSFIDIDTHFQEDVKLFLREPVGFFYSKILRNNAAGKPGKFVAVSPEAVKGQRDGLPDDNPRSPRLRRRRHET